MPSIQQEATSLLSSIPFDALIGGPMSAAVDAQVKSSKAAAEFIQSVAFHPDTQEVRHVSFVFENNGNRTRLQVPLLAIVPVPFLRIEELNINFKASISSETRSSDTASSSAEIGASAGGSITAGYAPFFSATVDFNASYSSKKDSASTRDSRYSVEYTIDISCRAVQDDIPAGLAQVLGILRESIKSEPVGRIDVDTSGDMAPELLLPATAGGTPPELTLSFVARNANGEELKQVMVEFACQDPAIAVMIPRARTGNDGKVQTKIKYVGKPVDNSSGHLAANAIVGSLRVGASAPGAVGAADVDLKVG